MVKIVLKLMKLQSEVALFRNIISNFTCFYLNSLQLTVSKTSLWFEIYGLETPINLVSQDSFITNLELKVDKLSPIFCQLTSWL